jgi:site-specific recombinase XerD
MANVELHTLHHGPHALRHACAMHLVAKGLSLKEIGDHLGHCSSSATRIYAKVNLPELRLVADIDLGGLS